MRLPISILSRPILAAILLCTFIAVVPGEDLSGAGVQPDPRRVWHDLAKDRKEFDVSDPALLPSQLALAAEQSGCHYKDDIERAPVRFISVENRRLALVPCFGIIGSHQVFDLTDLRRPKLMEFPVMSRKGGFGTTTRPGAITWKKEAGVFEAETGSDLKCTGRVRHTYRPDVDYGFVIVRVEVKTNECRQDEWATIWEAPRWPESVVGR
jgi:hypothetical protein